MDAIEKNMENLFDFYDLPGDGQLGAVMASSRRALGPMNLIGREHFEALQVDGITAKNKWAPPPIEAGDLERRANRAAFLDMSMGITAAETVVPKISHGCEVKYAKGHNHYMNEYPCDAIVTDVPTLALTICHADCPPVCLIDGTARVLALIHAGWKPLSKGIIEKTIVLMRRLGAHPGNMKAQIGPSIRKCCYEVGPEVATAVDGLPHQGQLNIDLPDLIVARLVARGVPMDLIGVEEKCTKCAVDKMTARPLYFSYRRTHKANPSENGMTVAMMDW